MGLARKPTPELARAAICEAPGSVVGKNRVPKMRAAAVPWTVYSYYLMIAPTVPEIRLLRQTWSGVRAWCAVVLLGFHFRMPGIREILGVRLLRPP